MKRLLVVAGDRALTRFIGEALLQRPISDLPKRSDTWDIARAHTALEAYLLVSRGGRPFDALVVDHPLPDQEVLSLIEKIRGIEDAKDVPLFLMSERGRDQHLRHLAADRFGVAGFLEKPVTAESLKTALEAVEKKRRILLVESREDLAERYHGALAAAGYLVEFTLLGQDAVQRATKFRPDLVVSALVLEDLRGIDVCVELKKLPGPQPMRVLLYGQVSALANAEITENAQRADDFVQAPFDDEVLTERVAALIGRGPGMRQRWRRGPSSSSHALKETLADVPAPAPSGRTMVPARSIQPNDAPDEADTQDNEADTQQVATPTPPPSASPKPVGPTKRSTRRVPCNIKMSVRNGGRTYESKTLDISHGGIFLETDEVLEIGTMIDMRFQIPNTNREVGAVGKVAWVGKSGTADTMGVGVKFSKIDPADLQVIVDYVNRVARVVYSAS